MKDIKIPLAVLLSVAIFWTAPNGQPPVNNSVAKAAVTKQAEPTTANPKLGPSSEPKAEVVAQVEEPAPQAPAPQPETPEPQPQAASVPAAPLSNKETLMQQAGISASDFAAVDYIATEESSWCPFRYNGDHRSCDDIRANPGNPGMGSGAYGLCQALPASKMASAGSDWETNPVTQLKWCHDYSNQRYGGWWSSFAFWQANRWW